MSFQRSLTGESSIYANVILNTNICSSSVSTINLSATNASFTNITTNTWTTGNISVPNVIATSAYFSVVYTSNLNFSNGNFSNLSTLNISNSSGFSTSTLSAYIANVSTINNCLISTSNVFSKYGNMSNLSVSSLQIDTQLDVDGNVIGVQGQFQELQIKNSGGNTVYTISEGDDITHEIENSGTGSIDFKRLGVSILRLNNNQALFYKPINASEINVSNASITNLSVSTANISTLNICTLTTSVGNAYITNTSTANVCLVATSSIYSTYGYVSNLSVSSLQIDTQLDVDGNVIGVQGQFQELQIKNSGGNTVYTVTQGGDITHNIENAGVGSIDFTRLGVSILRLNNNQALFYQPINASQINVSNASITNLSVVTGNVSVLNTSTFTTSVGNAYITNTSTANVCLVAVSTVNSCYAYVSNSSIDNLSVGNFTATTFTLSNSSLSNLSVSVALTATSGTITRLSSTSMFVSNLSASNISVPGRISVSNISATSISATGRINGDTIRAATDIISVGNLSGLDVFGQGFHASTVNVSLQVNASTVSCRNFSSVSVNTSWVNASNISVTNLSITTGTATTLNISTGNFSTLNVSTFTPANLSVGNLSVTNSGSIVNLSVSSLGCSSQTYYTSGGVSTYGTVTLTGGKMLIQSVGLAATAIQLANTGNVRFEISSNGVSSFVPFYVSTGNFCNINVSSAITATTITTTTDNATTGNFSNINVSSTLSATTVSATTGNFSTLNASTWNLPSTLSATTVSATTGNFSTLNASTWNLPATLSATTINTSTINASLGNISNLSISTLTGSTITVSATSLNSSGTFSVSNIYVNNLSDVNNLRGSGPLNIINDAVYMTNVYGNQGGTTYLQMNYWKTSISANDQGWTMYCDEPRGSVIDGGALKLTFKQADIEQLTNTSTAGWTFRNVINSSYQTNLSKLAVSNFSVSNVSATNMSVANDFNSTNIGVTNITASVIDTSSLTVSSALVVPMNISTNNNSGILRVYPNSTNTQTTGIRLPNYIDGIDTGTGLFIGYNQTAGFINFDRIIRANGNITLDGNLNQITTTNNLGIGRSQTTGNIFIGDTAMTGNVCINTSGGIQIGNTTQTGNISLNTSGSIQIGSTTMPGNINLDTAGDIIFSSDRRSTWNTSGIVASSTQLGSFYQQTTANTVNKTSTGQTYAFSPNNANTSLTTVPVGLYLVSGQARVKTFSLYNSSISAMNCGICWGTQYSFTSGSTTRIVFASVGALNTSGTNNFIQTLNFTGIVNMSVTGQYIGGFMSATASQAATVGSIDLVMDYCTVVKIA